MMMKYFRFLYRETGRCFIHFGEIRDTKTEEHFTFLYLRGNRQHVEQEESGHTLFLCPKRLDLVVLGDTEECSLEMLKGFLGNTETGMLICDANSRFAILETIPGIEKVVRLGDKENGDGTQIYQTEAAGWKFTARSCGKGSVMLSHALASGEKADSKITDGMPDAKAQRMDEYKDCVMSVKVVSGDKRCCCEEEPDGYGCALGCALHQDYDVCNYRRREPGAYVTGTVLLPEDWNKEEDFPEEIREELPGIRFFGIPGSAGPEEVRAITEGAARISGNSGASAAGGEPGDEATAYDYKRYFIGTGREMPEETIAAVSRSGMYHIPVILEPGKALCCSGLLKYSE